MNTNLKICYWSIAWGDYSYMLQTLIDSFHEFQIDGDFIAISDRELKNCINVNIDPNIPLDLSNYMFKFDYLKKLVNYDYDYFVFIDSDSIFVRKPAISPLEFMKQGNPWHAFLESPINSNKTVRGDWWGVPNQKLEAYFRDLGVRCQEIRNMNAGYWVCKRNFINRAYTLGYECYNYFVNKGYRITEEIPMSYITNHICGDVSKHFHEKYFDYWASDWISVFLRVIPFDKEWEYESYMTGEKLTVNPALVHAMRSKPELINKNKFV
jgi:hypothetical protein